MKKLIFALLLFACGAASGRGRGPVFTPADSPEIRFTGRAATVCYTHLPLPTSRRV